MTWSAYFAFPEPKRRIIVASHDLAVPALESDLDGARRPILAMSRSAGIPPELFAPAELEVMRRASAKIDPRLSTVRL